MRSLAAPISGLPPLTKHLTSSAAALGALAVLKLVASSLVLASGFVAISDDDFARVVIAQDFARAPRLDPSGTSWLPLPFWFYGAPMLLFGPSWEVARVMACLAGMLSVGLVWGSARLMGATARGALFAGVVAALFPYSLWLGVSTVPELPTAALIVFAIACSTRAQELARSNADSSAVNHVGTNVGPHHLRLLAALAISAACASRYEAWPVAMGLAAALLLDHRLERRSGTLARHSALHTAGLALLTLSFPLAWLAHGVARHDDALFFVRRVTDYKQALGATTSSWTKTLVEYPSAFVSAEPELLAGALLLVAAVGTTLLWRRAAFLLLLMLATLIVSDARGGGPTHHPERALVSCWLFAAMLVGDALDRWGDARCSSTRSASRLGAWPPGSALLAWVALLVVVGWAAHRWVRRPDLSASFVRRDLELEIGRRARETAGNATPLVLATNDYGYFAILAALGTSEHVHVLDNHDPRGAKATEPASQRLHQLVTTTQAKWAIVPDAWPDPASLGPVIAQNPAFLLISLGEHPPTQAAENSPLPGEVH